MTQVENGNVDCGLQRSAGTSQITSQFTRRSFARLSMLAAGSGLAGLPAWPQLAPVSRVNAQTQPVFFKPHELPMGLRVLLVAHGTRLQAPGKERLVLSGAMKRGSSSSSLQLTNDLPGKVRIDENGGRAKSVVFDLENLSSPNSIEDVDEDMAESFALDTPESFFLQIRYGGALRMIGQNFKVKNETGFGSQVDIFELTSIAATRRDKQVRRKHFLFDFRTGLLRQVAYSATKAGRPYRVATVYSEYSQLEGNAVPGKIQRVEDGAEVFAFTRQTATLASLTSPGKTESK